MEPDSTLASDAERNAAVERLSTACAEGRITLGEFGDRSAQAQAARTRHELEALLVDLPPSDIGTQGLMPWLESPGTRTEVAADKLSGQSTERHFSFLGVISRRGRWKLKPNTTTVALIGGSDIDLSQALISDYDVTLKVVSIVGRVEVIVPRGVRVEVRAASLIGGRDIEVDDATHDSPMIRLTAFSLVGGVQVRSK